MPRRSTHLVLAISLAAVLILLAVTGCTTGQKSASSPSGLVGTWLISMGSGAPAADGPTWQFTQDGKLIQSPGKGGGVQQTTGEYQLKGDVLSIVTHPSGSSATATMAVQWISNDQFQVSMGGGAISFTRQK